MGNAVLEKTCRAIIAVALTVVFCCVSYIPGSLAYADEGHVGDMQGRVSSEGATSASMQVVVEVAETEPEVVTIPKKATVPSTGFNDWFSGSGSAGSSGVSTKSGLPQTGDNTQLVQLLLAAEAASMAALTLIAAKSRRESRGY